MKRMTIISIPAAEYDLTLDDDKWDLLAIKELQSETCYCGARKTSMQTFCRAEYFALPPKKRAALYNRIGEGYKEAYRDAREYLYAKTMCAECGKYPPDAPSRLCAACGAYKEHTAI